MTRHLSFVLAALVLGASAAWAQSPAPLPDVIDYNRDVRQILSNNCYACHGPDQAKRQGGLRLDKQQDALAALESGGFAIVPGDLGHSKLVERITTNDSDQLMPPKDAGKPLTPAEIATL